MQLTEWPIGLSTGCFYNRSIHEVLEPIHSSGFREIEICSYPRHLDYHMEEGVQRAGARMRGLGLRPFSFHAPFAGHIDITSLDPGIREASVRELLTACRAAALMGVEHIVLHPGPEREGRPPEHEFLQHMHHAVESLNCVAACCSESGLHLLFENMLPHLLFGRASDMLFLLGAINTCAVGACLDTGHAHLSGDLGGVIHKLSGHLKMVHVNDNRGDRDAHLAPGEGTINWPWVIAELRRCQFNGTLILELSSRENEPVDDMLARAVRARDYLRSFIAPPV